MARKKASPKKSIPLEEKVRAVLEEALPDDVLQQKLEALAVEPAFNGLTYLWGPALYERNPARFRPFILAHFSSFGQTWMQVPWKRNAAALDAWLEQADRRDDADIFSRLYVWKHGGIQLLKQWSQDLRRRFEAAGDSAQRSAALRKLDVQGLHLDDETATALYALDAPLARPFILRHAPGGHWTGTRTLPEKVCALAQQQGDDELYFALYRLNVPGKLWQKDVEALARTVTDPQQLVAELQKRHPGWIWDMDISKVLSNLLQRRGRAVIPYLLEHVDQLARWGSVVGGKGGLEILEQARRQGWWDLTSALVRKGDNGQYNKEVLALLEDRKQPDEVVFRHLAALSGPSFQWQWRRSALEHYQPLKDATAVVLYRRFPELVHGPFRKHLGFTLGDCKGYPDLVSAARDEKDAALVDYLAAQVILTCRYYRGGAVKRSEEWLLKHYQSLRSQPVEFTRRLATVLGHLPAHSLGRRYRPLLRNSPLARLFFEEACADLLEDPRALRDLLEAAEIHVQLLALRALGQDDERARQLAADNLDLLQATLLQSMTSKSRRLALRALANAATTLDSARRIAERARQALVLPEKGYPRGPLLALLAGVNQRWPQLRGTNEQPVVYRSKKQRSKWA